MKIRRFLKTQIQTLLRDQGPLTINEIMIVIDMSMPRISAVLHEMADSGCVKKMGKSKRDERGPSFILWGATEKDVQETKPKPPRKGVKIGDSIQIIIDAAKAPRLPIKHHELTLALFGMES